MTLIFLFLVVLTAEPLDVKEAHQTYKELCGPSGRFTYGVEASYERTGVSISALFWGDVDRKGHKPGERCAVQWTLAMFGQAVAEDLYARMQALKWTTGEVWLYRRGFLFRLKRDEKMAPGVGSWYLGVYGYGGP